MVVRIARQYNQRGLSFCIITFYDPQRAAISKAIEAANLPTGCVYNVDSFQGMAHPSRISTAVFTLWSQPSLVGNEADYVILSSVRTQHAGFLNSQPRMNVALTRCRKGMVVVTNNYFLSGAGRNTLLGKLCHAWSQRSDAWIDWKAMLNDSVALPGLRGRPHNTLSGAALVYIPASVSQRLPVHTQTHEQLGPGLHTVTPRLDAPPRTTITATTYDAFPSLPTVAHSRATETRQPVQLGASQIPECDPISFPGQSQAATHQVCETVSYRQQPQQQPQQKQQQPQQKQRQQQKQQPKQQPQKQKQKQKNKQKQQQQQQQQQQQPKAQKKKKQK